VVGCHNWHLKPNNLLHASTPFCWIPKEQGIAHMVLPRQVSNASVLRLLNCCECWGSYFIKVICHSYKLTVDKSNLLQLLFYYCNLLDPLDNRSTSREDGCAKRRAEVGSPTPWCTCQNCQNADVEHDGGTRLLTGPQTPGMGDPRPAVGRQWSFLFPIEADWTNWSRRICTARPMQWHN